jgi:hypothetical protein
MQLHVLKSLMKLSKGLLTYIGDLSTWNLSCLPRTPCKARNRDHRASATALQEITDAMAHRKLHGLLFQSCESYKRLLECAHHVLIPPFPLLMRQVLMSHAYWPLIHQTPGLVPG